MKRYISAERAALGQIVEQIHRVDPLQRHPYIQEFLGSFQAFERTLPPGSVFDRITGADLILIADYHSLPASQKYVAELLPRLQRSGRPLVLALECFYRADQANLDLYLRGCLTEAELRRRTCFDDEWGFPWSSISGLLRTAKRLGIPVAGIDLPCRHGSRAIAQRDRHAARSLARIRECNPEARIVVLFGESHLAPSHLPAEIRKRDELHRDRVLTVLQNVDELFWQSYAMAGPSLPPLQVQDDVLCVFTSTLFAKYESYRRALRRWHAA